MEQPISSPFTVAALYHFAHLDAPDALRQPLLDRCNGLGLCGTLILAPEGINGTVAGSAQAVDRIVGEIRSWPGFDGLDVKYSAARDMPFRRMKVKIKPEIVTLRVPGLDPVAGTGEHIEPTHWNSVITDPGTIVIDTRNSFEVGYGSFEGAIDPGTRKFVDFPAWFDAEAEKLRAQGHSPRVAMFCTGGIRCEKASAYVKSRGFDACQLKGGILAYLEQVPEKESLWQGSCFVFDEREALEHGLKELSDKTAEPPPVKRP